MHISRMPAAVTGVLRNPATPSRKTFPPLMICDPDERKNTFHGRMLRTGLGGDGLWTVRRNQPRRPLWGGAGGCGRCMVSEGDLPVAGGRMTDEWMREMRKMRKMRKRGDEGNDAHCPLTCSPLVQVRTNRHGIPAHHIWLCGRRLEPSCKT